MRRAAELQNVDWVRRRARSGEREAEVRSAADALGAPVPSGGTRRTVTVDHGTVPTTPGTLLRLGDVELEVVRKAAPCRVMETAVGPGARRALHDRGGAVCRVLTSGAIAVGDPVHMPDGT